MVGKAWRFCRESRYKVSLVYSRELDARIDVGLSLGVHQKVLYVYVNICAKLALTQSKRAHRKCWRSLQLGHSD